MSSDGRYVVFHSDATNLVVGDTNATTDVFRHDRQTGTTIRVSMDSSGNQTTLGASSTAISADGRFVVFVSLDGSLAPGPAGCYCVFIHDVISGTTDRVADQGAFNPSVSADGRYVVFESPSPQPYTMPPDPPPNGDTNGTWDVYVKDQQGGTALVSRATTGGSGNNMSGSGRISDDGLFVAFYSLASNLVSNDSNGFEDIFIRDMQAGTTQLVSVDSAENQANNINGQPSINADGRYVAFKSYATNLVPVDTNNIWDVFVRDVQAGTTPTPGGTVVPGSIAVTLQDSPFQVTAPEESTLLAIPSSRLDALFGETPSLRRALGPLLERHLRAGPRSRADGGGQRHRRRPSSPMPHRWGAR